MNKIITWGIVILFIGTISANTIAYSPLEKKSFLDKDSDFLNYKIYDLKMKLLMKIGNFPSLSTCIIKGDEVVWSKSYGYSDLYRRKPAEKDTIYGMASISKTMLTTAFLKLYENKSYDFSLDDDVNKWLPFELRNPNYPNHNITLRMLLSHRSSIFDYFVFSTKGLFQDFTKLLDFPDDLGNWLENILVPGRDMYRPEYWSDEPPGQSACYSNIGFFVISYVFEKIANESLESYCQKNIFGPLEMYDTSYCLESLDKERLAVPYIKKLGVFIPLPNKDFKGFAGVGGLRTTLEDLSHFLIAHMNNGVYNGIRILENETIELMHNTSYPETKISHAIGYNYGYGWWSSEICGKRLNGHGGIIPGVRCTMVMDETTNIGYIVLINYHKMMGLFNKLDNKAIDGIFSLLFEKADEYLQ